MSFLLVLQSTGPYPPSEVLEKLHECLAAPPDITTLRVNTLRYTVEDSVDIISKIIAQVSQCFYTEAI